MAWVPCAWAVIGRPCRCASSTAARSSSGAELGQLGPAARGHVAAAGHDLDDVDAALGVLADGGPDPSTRSPRRRGSGSARRAW